MSPVADNMPAHALMKQSDFFRGCDDQDLLALAGATRFATYAPDQDIVREGDSWRVTTPPQDLHAVRTAIEEADMKVESGDLVMVSQARWHHGAWQDARAPTWAVGRSAARARQQPGFRSTPHRRRRRSLHRLQPGATR